MPVGGAGRRLAGLLKTAGSGRAVSGLRSDGPLARAFLFSALIHFLVVVAGDMVEAQRPISPLIAMLRISREPAARSVPAHGLATQPKLDHAETSRLVARELGRAMPKRATLTSAELIPWMDRLVAEPMAPLSPSAIAVTSPYKLLELRAAGQIFAREISEVEVGKQPLHLPPGNWAYSMQLDRRPYALDSMNSSVLALPSLAQSESLIIAVFIAAEGQVNEVQLLSGKESFFRPIADELYQLRFDPGVRNGVAVNAIMLIAISVEPE